MIALVAVRLTEGIASWTDASAQVPSAPETRHAHGDVVTNGPLARRVSPLPGKVISLDPLERACRLSSATEHGGKK